MIKLSIIIPYYNTYDYTILLLKELEKQVTEEVEVILIDDGCHEERFNTFSFLTILHNDTNIGAPKSWNRGLSIAKGKYIGFIDSDDEISDDYISVLINAINNYDEDELMFGWKDLRRNIIVTHPHNVGIWKAIYKRTVCPKFREDWPYRSDVPFQRDLARRRQTSRLIPKVLYGYNSYREGSLTWERINNQKRFEEPPKKAGARYVQN